MLKNRNINIRCNETAIKCLDRLTKKYSCSQSDLIQMLIFAFNDYDLQPSEQDKMFKFIVKHLKYN